MMKLIVTCKKEKGKGLAVEVEKDDTSVMGSVEELITLMHVRAFVQDALDAMKKDGPDMDKILSLMEESERNDFMSYISYKAMQELKESGMDVEDVIKSAKETARAKSSAKRTDSTPPDWVQEELDKLEAEMEKEKVENERR